MAKIVLSGIGVTGIYGSVGGSTFQNTSAGLIVRNKGMRVQTAVYDFSGINLWRVTSIGRWQQLTLDQKESWNLWAGAWTKQNRFGQNKKMTGFNWFDSINYQRNNLGLSFLLTPPIHELPQAPPNFNMVFTPTAFLATTSGSFDYTNNALIFWSTPPTIRSGSSQRQIMRKIMTVQVDPAGPIDLTSHWQVATKYNWADKSSWGNANIFMWFQSVKRSNGIATSLFQKRANVITGQAGIGSMIVENTFIVA